MGGRERALAGVAAVLFVGGGLGVLAVTEGVIGAPSKSSFVAQADAVCASQNGAVTGIAKPASYPELAAAASTVATTTDTELGRLRALRLPGPAHRGGARAVMTAMAATNLSGRRLQAAAGAKDPAMTAAATREMAMNSKDAAARAGGYGLSACAAGMQSGIETVLGGASGVVKTAFITKAGSLCAGAVRAIDALPPPRTEPREMVHSMEQLIGILEKVNADIKALPIPPGDEATLADLFSTMDKESQKARAMLAPTAALDLPRLKAAQKEFDAVNEVVGVKADAYGIGACSDKS